MKAALILGLAGLAASATLALAATSAAVAPKAQPKTYTVVIDKMVYAPASLDARVGDTVVWVNRDIFQHTATAKDGSFNLDLRPNASGQTVLTKAGALDYTCTYHPGMAGRITVKAR